MEGPEPVAASPAGLGLDPLLGSLPVVVLATYREEEIVEPDLSDLLRRGLVVALAGLAVGEVAELAAGTGLDAAAVHARTGGNPLFAGELLRMTPSSDALPASVVAVISRRVERLSPGSRRVLAVASVLGQEFSFDPVAEVAGVPAESLLVLLEEARWAGVLGEVGVRRACFTHALALDAVYGQLGVAERAALSPPGRRVPGQRPGSRSGRDRPALLVGGWAGSRRGGAALAPGGRRALPGAPRLRSTGW